MSRHAQKLATATKLQRVAITLAAELGTSAATAELISKQAGVSLRTFFNHYPQKDAAFVLRMPPIPQEARAAFLASRAPLLEGLWEVMAAHLKLLTADMPLFRAAAKLTAEDAGIFALQQVEWARLDADLANLVAERMDWPAGDVRTVVVVSFIRSISFVAIARWDGKDPDPLAACRVVQQQVRSFLESQGSLLWGT